MGTTHIVIPVRDQLHLTQSIVEQLLLGELGSPPSWDKCLIFDNGSVDGTWDWLLEVHNQVPSILPIQSPGSGIYDMWDHGFKHAMYGGADFVAILNNDLIMEPNTIQILRDALVHNEDAWISYPDYNCQPNAGNINYRETRGTYRHGGMSGFCFMLRTAPIDWTPLVDPIFKWYGGDDDIAFNVEKRGGKQIRVVGLGVQHIHEGTARHHDLGAQKAADMESIRKKWGK